MSGSKRNDSPNLVLIVLALVVTAAAVGNAACAVLTDSVWILTGSGAFSRGIGTTPTKVERSVDPVTFYVALGSVAALAVYMDLDLWRRYRRRGRR